MKIGIDARFFGSVGKGLGRYTQKLIENLEKIDSENQYFIFLRRENYDEYQPVNKNFHKVLADYRWYTFSEQLNMPRILRKYKLDLVHFPHFNVPILYRRPFVITIHDLILIHFPTVRGTTLNPLVYKLKFLAYKLTIGSAVKRAKKIIAVSKFTKNDILENYKIPANKIAVTYESCDLPENNFQKTEEIIRKYNIKKPYLLYVGNAYPHKNLEKLILAFDKVRKINQNLNLVLVGKKDFFYNRLQEKVKNENIKNIIFTGFVSDDDLYSIYKNSSLYVFPSLYEGFGLPPLEAMACNTPVVTSDHRCMKEILQDSAYYFKATDVEDISATILQVLNDKSLCAKLVKKGRQQVLKYSWSEMAKQTQKIYGYYQKTRK